MGKWKQGLVGFLLKGLIICVSFVAVFGITYRLNQTYLREAAETVVVVVAAEDLPPGTLLTPEKLILAERPAMGLGTDVAEDIAVLLEQEPLYAGEIGFGVGDVVRPDRLRTEAEGDDEDGLWDFSRQEQARLVAVETSLVRSSGDWLRPGMLVDAIVYIPAKESYEDPQPSATIGPEEDPFLRGLLVIDRKNANGLTLGDMAGEEGYSRDALPAVVTLMVDKEDIERVRALIRYNEEGRIYLSPATDGTE